jgi:hypothetical protein
LDSVARDRSRPRAPVKGHPRRPPGSALPMRG